MHRTLTLIAALVPAPVVAAELWCMPDTFCARDGKCRPTSNAESSVRLHDLDADQSTLRTHAEDVMMTRKTSDGVVEWTGTDAVGRAEYLIWTRADMGFTYTVTEPGGDVFKSFGKCEVQ